MSPADDAFNGKAQGLMTNGVDFEGEMLNGRMEGKVKLMWPDGLVYHGTMIANQITGQGQELILTLTLTPTKTQGEDVCY